MNINDLMLINLHISLITKRLFRYFDRHSDKTATHSELLLDINNFSETIVRAIRKSHEFSFKIVQVITIVVSNPVNFLVNARSMTSEHCQRILVDVTIFRHLAVESTFLYSLHPGFSKHLSIGAARNNIFFMPAVLLSIFSLLFFKKHGTNVRREE